MLAHFDIPVPAVIGLVHVAPTSLMQHSGRGFIWTSNQMSRGGAPLYKPYRYVPPNRVGFLRRFGLKTGIHFAHFGLESGMVFEGTTEYMNVRIVSISYE